MDDALAIDKGEGRVTGGALFVFVDAAWEDGFAVVGGIQEEGITAFSADSVLVVDAVNIFFVALTVSSQKLVKFADQAYFPLRLSAAPAPGHKTVGASRTAFA